jgi:hypothetical protein
VRPRRSSEKRKKASAILRIPPDLDLNYVVDDITEPWSQPSTVLMHGNAESGAAWYGWVPELARRHCVVRPDMHGFGRSTAMPPDFPRSLDCLIDCQLIDALGQHLFASKLPGDDDSCDVVAIKVEDVAPHGYSSDRATVRQRKTGRPVRFELTEQTHQAIDDYIRAADKKSGEHLFRVANSLRQCHGLS